MKTKETFMYVLGALIMLLCFTLFIAIVYKAVPAENEKLIYMAAGVVFGWGTSIVTYFYGSSKGSADKTEALTKSTTK